MMNANRKADLQRKLSMAPLPKPPAGLAERIKKEIPKQLRFSAEAERERLSQSVGFSIRVAASVLILVSSAYLALQLFTRLERQPPAAVVASKRVPATEVRQMARRNEQPVSAAEEAAPLPPPKKLANQKEKLRDLKDQRKRDTNAIAVAAAAPAPTPAPAADAVAAEAPPAPQAVATGETMRAGLSRDQANVAKAAYAERQIPASVFGVEVNRRDYDELTAALGRGQRPPKINIVALVQHFSAPAPSGSPIRDVRLEAEAAATESGKHFLRVSIDSAVVASDASIAVDFNALAVKSHRALVGESSARVPVMATNTTVTLLHEFEIKENLDPRELIVTVRLRYRLADDAKPRLIDVQIRNADVSSWSDASPRTKSAVLAASLGEALRSRLDTASIASQARKAGLQELAALAEKARL